MEGKRALVIGIAGQDGSYLAELLLADGYDVLGVVRSETNLENLAHVRDQLELLHVDLLDEHALLELLSSRSPQEVYNLASPSFVPMSWRQPVLTAEFGAVSVTALLEAVRHVGGSTRFFQASSSEIFGEPSETPQTERTPLAPVTPYGVAKAYGHLITRCYRRHYGLHASSGILFNHESPRRPHDFVPRKIAHAAASISLGLTTEVSLGNLEARRDWGFAGDYVRAMWLALQQDHGDDYVIATGRSNTVRELARIAFAHVGLDYEDHVRVDESLTRGSAEPRDVLGDPTRAREQLGWTPTVDFEALVGLLVDADLERLRSRVEAAEGSRG